MRGIHHILTHILILVIFITLYISFGFSFTTTSISFWTWAIGTYLFLVGSILPDSDSNNKGSLIFTFIPFITRKLNAKRDNNLFYSVGVIFGILALPMAFITNLLEKPISIITKRKIGHRESLHTILGVFLTSLFWAITLLILYLWISSEQISIVSTFFFWLIILFFSQFLHLLEDFLFGLKIKIK